MAQTTPVQGSMPAPTASAIRVVVADDHPILQWSLRQLIATATPPMILVGATGNGADALRLVRQHQPDVVVLEPDLDVEASAELVPALARIGTTRVVLFTRLRDNAAIDNAVLAGALGVVRKREPMDTVIRAIAKVYQGELWLDRVTTARLFGEFARGEAAPPDPVEARIASLTRRERSIVAALASQAGARNRKLAEFLNMSEHTLRNHLCNIYDKLGVDGRLALFDLAKRRGLHRLDEM